MNSHKLHIHNCVLRDGSSGSMTVYLYHSGYEVKLDLMNITALNGGDVVSERDIFISTGSEANYLVTIRDSYIGHSKGAAISVVSQHPKASVSQLLHITNSIIDRGAAGINFEYYHYNSTGKSTQQMIIENSIIMDASGDRLRAPIHRAVRVLAKNSQLAVVLRNVSLENNKFPQTSVIYLHSVTDIELIDCRFVGNRGTPIILFKSIIKVSGTLSFVNNTAYQGGAMVFHKEGYMSVSLEKKTEILFINNYAEHVGGAIFAKESETNQEPCFLQLTTYSMRNCSDFKKSNHLSIVFTNNTAHNGGDAIYGASLYNCIAAHCKDEYDSIPILGAYIFITNYWNLVQYDTGHHSNLSLISSAPSRVCLCEDGQPDCLTAFVNNAHCPGEKFSISAVVVGQGFGTADGTVYAQFTNNTPLRLDALQLSQQVEHSSCTELKYTIFSANENELMVLSISNTLSEYHPHLVAHYTKSYELIKHEPHDVFKLYIGSRAVEELLAIEVFISVSLLPCPAGFMLSDQPAKCVCHTTLQLLNITCNIDDQTVHRGGTVWVNASFAGNKSNGVIVHHHCPYGYCKCEELDIRLDFPDTQCNFNHSGILCGGCRPARTQSYTGNFSVSQMLKQVHYTSHTICYCRNSAGGFNQALEPYCFRRNTEWTHLLCQHYRS